MKIEEKQKEAFEKASGARGLMARICRETGISKSQLSKYKSGTLKTMSDEVWQQLEPYLQPYLDEQEKIKQDNKLLTAAMLDVWNDLDYDDQLEGLKFLSRLRQEKKSFFKSS